MLLVALMLSTGLAACADRTYPAWLPAPVTDDPVAQEIISGVEPPSPYLLKPYPPPRPWSWPTTSEQRASVKPAPASFDPQRVSRKLKEGMPTAEAPPRDFVERAPLP
jgi:hypothetical protein